ncbi:limonoid UDP-glucosyltransferase-like [Cynara cardunculus var. scolymus]|uniref:Glycosyltransferase n=1 Tax=Cynara cardunculus var. scolymus TaxID=59895 RepID=A0A118JV97_CYNCS|nr:limonoid UDP-glucosyltransferase-like [Cynara cardunculus var. scolymus]KVH93326.1 UDP-glucuronosyl/UDP-glucosyltransferase [Cynara cardunculus var. scolymus]
MASKQGLVHVFLVSFPAQGHVNPLLRLGKLLASKGNLFVTFSSSKSIGNKMKKAGASASGDPIPVGNRGGMIRFEFFDDGCSEDNDDERNDRETYLNKLEVNGKRSLTKIFNQHAQDGRPVSCLINNPFVPWVCDLAEELNIFSAMLWVQSCACFSSYYHYENSLVPFPSEKQPDIDVQLPHMPLLKSDEIPSSLHPSAAYPFLKRVILGQFKNLSKTSCVLMETFQELEGDLITYMSKICPIRPVGPLFKNPLLETSTNICGDLIKADECLEWLDSKPPSSVVYISFGSVVSLSQEQVTEMAYGVLNSGVSFLWVLRMDATFTGVSGRLPKGFFEEAGERGKVVQWSPQAKVLSHTALSCFVSHCGWNSTMEALSSGVPVVAFPRWGDQVTDAKYLVDEWKVGIRMSRGEDEQRVIGREEIAKCLKEATNGEKAVDMKTNALKWKKTAEEAVAEDGTSDRNMQEFVDEIRKRSLRMAADREVKNDRCWTKPELFQIRHPINY